MSMKAKFLSGKNIYIKGMEPEDINDEYLEFINNSSANTYLTSNAFPKTKFDLLKYYKSNQSSKNHILFSIFTNKGNIRIGNASISAINWITRNCQYGRLIKKEFQKKGYGTELLGLLMSYIFELLNLNSLTTEVSENNIGSMKTNIKNGMKLIGTKKDMFFINNKYENSALFHLTKKEYLKFIKNK